LGLAVAQASLPISPPFLLGGVSEGDLVRAARDVVVDVDVRGFGSDDVEAERKRGFSTVVGRRR